jgi:hypothetical protein
MHPTIEGKPHRCSPSPIDAHPRIVSAYGRSEHLWSGNRHAARIQSGRIDWNDVKDRINLEALATDLLGKPVKRI